MSARKKSSVWTFYTETDQANKVKCILCDALISHGGSGRSASTFALTNHLRVKHDREYTQLQHLIHSPNPILPSVRPTSSNTTEELPAAESSLRQATIEGTFEYNVQMIRRTCLAEFVRRSEDIGSSSDERVVQVAQRSTSSSNCENTHRTFWSCYEELAAVKLPIDVEETKSPIASELDRYLSEVLLLKDLCPYGCIAPGRLLFGAGRGEPEARRVTTDIALRDAAQCELRRYTVILFWESRQMHLALRWFVGVSAGGRGIHRRRRDVYGLRFGQR
ncbi:unnamed protein product [Arctia plantaginis]|uniref:BED-type domain-containing protein n=1 Tax=Arctia plantaginis TaxID=874455 RepID=A0A8S1AYV9_ARCPL|nr:unnamed protein product [Arctia plantaginis]